jgi:hypothetical protein
MWTTSYSRRDRSSELTQDLQDVLNDKNVCEICWKPIMSMTYRGTGVCGTLHERVRKGEITSEQAFAVTQGLMREDGIK